MSYDAYMRIDTGGEYLATVCEIGNMTSNVSPMWRRAISAATGQEMGLADLEGKTGAEIAPILNKALGHICDPANATEYRAMNPSNGWGDVNSAVQYLRAILDACNQHPKAMLYISR